MKKTNRKKRQIGKSTIIWMSTASDQQCIEQLNKNSISKLTSYVKSTDSHSFFFFDVYLFLRERNRTQTGEKQKERETQNSKQAAGSQLSAQSLRRG